MVNHLAPLIRTDDNDEPRQVYDVYARHSISSNKGRGAEAGWVACPLCPVTSNKRFSGGRGISAHLHAVHTPWNPPKQKKTKLTKKQFKKRLRDAHCEEPSPKRQKQSVKENVTIVAFKPTAQQVEDWEKQVLELTAKAEITLKNDHKIVQVESVLPKAIAAGFDRTGQKKALSYEESLPQFLRYAASGNLGAMKKFLQSSKCMPPFKTRSEFEVLWDILNTTDRNGSTAQEWASGKGKLDCLIFLLELEKECQEFDMSDEDLLVQTVKKKKRKKREQKSPLHWAARHGHITCVDYLIRNKHYGVNEPAGDGTTPLHYACYGGHFTMVKHLIKCHGADPRLSNEWNCDASHWVAMSVSKDTSSIIKICNFLRSDCDLSFNTPQQQGHTPLHKAAQKTNVDVMKWLLSIIDDNAGLDDRELCKLCQPDKNGNMPSDILQSIAKDHYFITILKKEEQRVLGEVLC